MSVSTSPRTLHNAFQTPAVLYKAKSFCLWDIVLSDPVCQAQLQMPEHIVKNNRGTTDVMKLPQDGVKFNDTDGHILLLDMRCKLH